MQSLSRTESFQDGKCDIYSIKMSTDAKGWQKICLVCVYPKILMREDLEQEIQTAVKKDIKLRPLMLGMLICCLSLWMVTENHFDVCMSHTVPIPFGSTLPKNYTVKQQFYLCVSLLC